MCAMMSGRAEDGAPLITRYDGDTTIASLDGWHEVRRATFV